MGTGSATREEPDGFGFFHSRRRSSVTYFNSGESTTDMDARERDTEGGGGGGGETKRGGVALKLGFPRRAQRKKQGANRRGPG